jgi:hypothetical protein
LAAAGARAQSGGGYDLQWNSLDCGAQAPSSGGAYSLAGTIGQPDAGSLTGGAFALRGGFTYEPLVPTDVPPGAEPDAGPWVFRFEGNSPNPFAQRTAIGFALGREEDVEMRIFDLAGRQVRSVIQARLGPGRHRVEWDACDDAGRRVAHGVYLLLFRAGQFTERRKLALIP